MARKSTANTFEKGLVMDFNPITTPNNVMTSALNVTMITFNGNEYVLQSDMGNGRVETAYLPTGYVPMGIVEFGGIIYVASYNPLIGKSQLGSFPSPERNISSEEINQNVVELSNDDFGFRSASDGATTFYVQKNLYDDKLTPGDKYIVYTKIGRISANNQKLWDCADGTPNAVPIGGQNVTKAVKLSFATITDEGKIVKLANLRTYPISGINGSYIVPEISYNSQGKPNLDSYRNLANSPYNIFNSKVSGKLLLIAELITIDEFNISISCQFVGEDTNPTKDVDIYANISYGSEKNVLLYGVIAKLTESGKSSENKSFKWNQTTIESDDLIDENRDANAMMYEVPNYDYINRPEKSVTYEITPCMSFGPIKYLMRSGIIQLDKIGTGYISLYEWRYYIDNNNIMINWALQSYPEEGYEIAGVRFIMSCYDRNGQLDTIVYNVSKKQSYNGSFMENIPFDSDFYKFDDSGKLMRDRLYYVTIEVQYQKKVVATGEDITSRYKYFHRWLYTSNVFNKNYLDGMISDFMEIIPDIILKCDIDYEFKKDTPQKLTHTGLVSLEDPENKYSVNDLQSMCANQIYTEYYLSGKIIPKMNETYNLLKLKDSSVKIDVDISNENKSVTFDDYTTSSTGDKSIDVDDNLKLKENVDWDGVKTDFPEQEESDKIVEDPYNYGIYIKDEFKKTGVSGDVTKFDNLKILTIEYIKAYAKMSRKKVTYQGHVKPAAYDKESFALYNLEREGSHFKAMTAVAYCQCEKGGRDGYDSFQNVTSGFGLRQEGRKGNGLDSTVNDQDNVTAIAAAWADLVGPIACAIWTQNRLNKSSSLRDPWGGSYNRSWRFWNGGNERDHCSNSGYRNLLEANMGVHVFWKRKSDKQFVMMNMATRVGGRPDGSGLGSGGTTRLVFDRTVANGTYSLYDLIAAILFQVYIYEDAQSNSYFWMPDTAYYIDRIVANFNVIIKYKINTDANTKILINVDNDVEIVVDSTMRTNLYTANKAKSKNQTNDLDETNPMIDNNIKWNFLSSDGSVNASVSTLNSGVSLRDMIIEYMKNVYPMLVFKNDGSKYPYDMNGNSNKLYYIDDENNVAVMNTGFKLYAPASFDFTDENLYKIKLKTGIAINDSKSSYANKFVVEDGLLYIDDGNVGQSVSCNRTQGGKGDDGSVGKWNKFAPVADLKLFI